MKRYHSMLISILFLTTCTQNVDYPWFKGTLDDAISSMGSKMIMLDFYASW